MTPSIISRVNDAGTLDVGRPFGGEHRQLRQYDSSVPVQKTRIRGQLAALSCYTS